jgi:hypothetical protein
VGWSGDSVTPDAANRNYAVTPGLAAGNAVGALPGRQALKTPDAGGQEAMQPGVSGQFNQPEMNVGQAALRAPNVAHAGGTMTTMSHASPGNAADPGSGGHGVTLPPGAYLFAYVNQAGETKRFHATVSEAVTGIAIAWGKKQVVGSIRHGRFVSKDARADGTPVLEGTLSASGEMTGTYMAEAGGKLYPAAFTLKMQ